MRLSHVADPSRGLLKAAYCPHWPETPFFRLRVKTNIRSSGGLMAEASRVCPYQIRCLITPIEPHILNPVSINNFNRAEKIILLLTTNRCAFARTSLAPCLLCSVPLVRCQASPMSLSRPRYQGGIRLLLLLSTDCCCFTILLQGTHTQLYSNKVPLPID